MNYYCRAMLLFSHPWLEGWARYVCMCVCSQPSFLCCILSAVYVVTALVYGTFLCSPRTSGYLNTYVSYFSRRVCCIHLFEMLRMCSLAEQGSSTLLICKAWFSFLQITISPEMWATVSCHSFQSKSAWKDRVCSEQIRECCTALPHPPSEQRATCDNLVL